jgi:hypothetical protein
MPRAKPSRSGQSASRHLLRNLDDARELRRNPLVAGYFATSPRSRRRTPDEDCAALEWIRGLVHEALAALYAKADPAADRDGTRLGRMHAALLRCEIDRQAPELVAAELGLSDRQLRRERAAAHDAFLDAFHHAAAAGRPPAIVCADLAQLRLAEAVQLHCIGQSRLGLSVFASIAGTAPRISTRLESVCLATEAQLDAGRIYEAEALVAEANAIYALHGPAMDEAERDAFEEHIEFLEWAVRWQLGDNAGVAMRPPSIVAQPSAGNAIDEERRALRVRALAAYAGQRWEVGDVPIGLDAVRVAERLLPSIGASRIKERLAVMQVDAQLYALRGDPLEKDRRMQAVERLAEAVCHIRPLLAARADRLSGDSRQPPRNDQAFDQVLADVASAEKGSADRTFAYVACIAAQWHGDPQRAMWAAEVPATVLPQSSGMALLAQATRAQCAIGSCRFDDARAIVEGVRSEARSRGNARLRAGAERNLAAIALRRGFTRDARRLISDAMPVIERYGSRIAFTEACTIARRVGLN